MGAEFPESFLVSVDRLILSMHPKYKKKVKKSKKKKGALESTSSSKEGDAQLDEERKRQMRLFPGLSVPDQEWEPTTSYKLEQEKDKTSVVKGKEVDLGVDDLMAELEGVKKRVASGDVAREDDRGDKRRRDERSRSPERRRGRSPDFNQRDSGYGSRDGGGRGRDGYGGGGGGYGGRPRLDDAPVLYKVYAGKVASMKDFGAFVSLEGVAGRAEGASCVVLAFVEVSLLTSLSQAWSTSVLSPDNVSTTPPTFSLVVNRSSSRSCPSPEVVSRSR